MAEPMKCSRCGAELPPGAPGGHCPQCLLNFGLPSFTEPDEATPESDPAFVSDIPANEKPGDRIGRYQLVRLIGEGGMGTVWLAEQVKPVRRRVALKIIKLGMDSRRMVARFEAERQALALMDHPSIAKVFDAGAAESGRPYFVMELAEGTKITDYCDQHQVPVPERLKLFIQVCQAVQHAHQKGILHRDLKPSNILVVEQDGAPVPKVIDFGIAKTMTGESLTDKTTLFTAFEQFLGTPAYMSPEQAGVSCADIDTRSDIYSLGVLLYELLVGQPPFDATDLKRAALAEVLQTIRDKDPPPPSARLTALSAEELNAVALCRQCEPRKFFHVLRGDLDWIVMKALEKDRDRRYASANGLAHDVEQHLNHHPIAARPPDKLYLLFKIVRRNRTTVGAIAAFCALLLGLAPLIWTLVREKEHRQLAERALAQETDLQRQIEEAHALVESARYDQAQTLIAGISLSALEPNFELAQAYRELGLWQTSRRQWQEAVADFIALERVNRLDDPQQSASDCLLVAPAVIFSGNTNTYQQFRQQAIARFADTTDPAIIARVCWGSLLLPADEQFVHRLNGFYELAARSLNDGSCGEADARICLDLALMDYRRGNYTKAAKLSNRCLACGNGSSGPVGRPFASPGIELGYSGSRDDCAARLILGMAHYQLGLREEAQIDLAYADARKPMDWVLFRGANESADDDNSDPAALLDWIAVGILWREATNLVGEPPNSAVAAAVKAREQFQAAWAAFRINDFNNAQSTLGDVPSRFMHLEGSSAGAIIFNLGEAEANRGLWQKAASNWIAAICGPDGTGSLRDGQMYSGLYLRCTPMLLQAGNVTAYENLRHFALADIDRLGEPTDAEAVLLSCLLTPISDVDAASSLKELAGIASRVNTSDRDWKPLAELTSALLACRLGDRARMEYWLAETNHAVGYAAFDAMSHVIASLDYCELDQINQAKSEIRLCDDAIQHGCNNAKIIDGERSSQGRWFEWWMDRILFREAEERIAAAYKNANTAKQIPGASNR